MISFRSNSKISVAEQIKERQKLLEELRSNQQFESLFQTRFDIEKASTINCENLIGSVELPIGVAGQVALNGVGLKEEVIIPLATTEGALVASVNRGCKAISAVGGANVFVKKIGMSRAPVFRCRDGAAANEFNNWIANNWQKICQTCESTSSHLKLLNYRSWIRGRQVFVRFVFDTDEAMGMNMVTIALKEMWLQLSHELRDVEMVSLSSNVCCDKKDSMINRLDGRGCWVQAEVKLDKQTLVNVLKTTPEKLVKVHISKNLIGGNVAGSLSQNMQVANIAAAFFVATGQDLAHVVEASQSSTTIEIDEDGVYAAVTMPNVNIGSIGGGTWLPAQTQARNLITNSTAINSQQLAAVLCVAVLAGELSGLAALANNTLAQAHAKLGRLQK